MTSPGARVRRVITDKCIFDRDDQRNELVLTALFAGVTAEDVRASVGWDLRVAPSLATVAQPSKKQIAALHKLRTA